MLDGRVVHDIEYLHLYITCVFRQTIFKLVEKGVITKEEAHDVVDALNKDMQEGWEKLKEKSKSKK